MACEPGAAWGLFLARSPRSLSPRPLCSAMTAGAVRSPACALPVGRATVPGKACAARTSARRLGPAAAGGLDARPVPGGGGAGGDTADRPACPARARPLRAVARGLPPEEEGLREEGDGRQIHRPWSSASHLLEVFVDELDSHRPLPNCRGHTLDRPGANVTGGEHTWFACLQQEWWTPGRP